MIPVILSGGSGTRLWPLSRSMYPKQFLPLVHDNTMLQETLLRLDGLDTSDPIVVCNEDHRFIVAEQARQIGFEDVSIILEPFGRNTTPAIAIAALHATAVEDDALLLVLSADHEIADTPAFQRAVGIASQLAQQDKLVTFGIVPDHAATGYGYIKRGQTLGDGFKVDAFVEKPDETTATQYLETGDYYWNSGMFMFKASVYLDELERFNPGMLEHCKQAAGNMQADLGFLRLNKEAFAKVEADSIDYAVMEKTAEACVVPLDAGWSDIGSWSSLWRQGKKDASGNFTQGDVISTDTRDCFMHTESRLLTAVGVDNLIIVETHDAVMVADKSRSEEVKQIVNQLKAAGREEEKLHRIVYRPWGCFDSIDEGERYKVKRITVNPGAKLSVQMHHHRAEHWVVVKGTALVHRDEETIKVTENESVFIPLGAKHSLENPGKIPLEIIEVQSGSYLGEDDIVRFDDLYGRSDQ